MDKTRWEVMACSGGHISEARPGKWTCWCGQSLGERFEVVRVAEARSDLYAVADVDSSGAVLGRQTTSRKAALAVYPRTGTQRHRILAALVDRNRTRDELEEDLGLGGSSVHPRVLELITGGWIKETDVTRKTRRGQDAVVLAPTDRGLDAVRGKTVRASGDMSEILSAPAIAPSMYDPGED